MNPLPPADRRIRLEEKLANAPLEPGVYLLKDDQGTILYVGKARLLRKRLAAYNRGAGGTDAKTAALVDKIADVEIIVTGTEKEALILESNLIKKHRPRYNVDLKDDKRYPSLRLDPRDSYPGFSVVRKIGEDEAVYFGPFASAQAVRETLKIINRTFKLRKCKASEFRARTRPCLHCQMDGCLAPCCRDVPPEKYREQVEEAILFLKGRTGDLVRKIRAEMQTAADAQAYERAARLRDKLFSIERTVERQVAVTTDFMDRDIFAIARAEADTMITVLAVRGGFLNGSRHYHSAETFSTDNEALGAFIGQYYEKGHFIPKEVISAVPLEDAALIADWLSGRKQEKVGVHFPRRGEKRRLAEMAAHNAATELTRRLESRRSEMALLARLQQRLQLRRMPVRIECCDNSNTLGREPVAGLVVFENGRPLKSAYRKYKLKTVQAPDDYAQMAEMLRRRFGKGKQAQQLPQLLMVDGGKGQLGIAMAVLAELGLDQSLEAIGIAKRDEKKGETQDKIFKPGRANPVSFGREGDLLLFLQRIRDEAHRFAVGFHRRRRGKRSLRSILDGIPGIGPQRKKTLLRHFKSVANIRTAPIEEIGALPGLNQTLGRAVKQALDAAHADRRRGADLGPGGAQDQ